MAGMHEDRQRSTTFGEDPERYDRARPTYPAALIDELVSAGVHRVLDVGCGTGIASRLFAERGCDVLGVEQDERMAAVAERHGLSVDVATFEEWDPGGRRFDLVVSGQAWHWVDPKIGPQKAADVLRPGGRLGVFWNLGVHEPAAKAVLEAAYDSVVAELKQSYAMGTLLADDTAEQRAIEASGRFDPVDVTVFHWERRYTRDQWLDQLPTHSDHRMLPDDRRAALLDAVGSAIDALGGSILLRYSTKLISGIRMAD